MAGAWASQLKYSVSGRQAAGRSTGGITIIVIGS